MKIEVYVDGSYNINTGEYGSGVVMIVDGDQKNIKQYNAKGNNSTFAKQRNVAGEVFAVSLALNICSKMEHADELDVHVYYDYAGIECWATGKWAANTVLSQEYRKFVHGLPFKVNYHKVKAHTGNYFNEVADQLAKQAAGVV